jgi:hypothetical protein
MTSTKKSKEDLTPELVKQVLTYDPITGHLIWNSGLHSKRMQTGSRAGNLKKSGYRQVSLFGNTYAEHRLIWFMETGYWPEQVDHINQDRSDNRWINLREVTKAENARNRSRNPHSKVGEVGIWYNKRTFKYVAEITMNGKKVFQKSYDDVEQAIAERKAKALELGFHDNHGSKPTGI